MICAECSFNKTLQRLLWTNMAGRKFSWLNCQKKSVHLKNSEYFGTIFSWVNVAALLICTKNIIMFIWKRVFTETCLTVLAGFQTPLVVATYEHEYRWLNSVQSALTRYWKQ